MASTPLYRVSGFPEDVSEDDLRVARSRFLDATDELVRATNERNFSVTVQVGRGALASGGDDDSSFRQPGLASSPPRYSWDQLVLDAPTMQALVDALDWIHMQKLVYDTWGFSAVDPYPRTALNFHGPPGTGKTIAAHCAASRLERSMYRPSVFPVTA